MTAHRCLKMGKRSPKIRGFETLRYFGKGINMNRYPVRSVKRVCRSRFLELHLGRCSSSYAFWEWNIPVWPEESVIADDARGQQDGQ